MTKVVLISNVEAGTLLDNPKAMEGFTSVVPTDVNAIVVAGIEPRIPRVFGTRNEHYTRLLEIDIEKKYGPEIEKKILSARTGFMVYEISQSERDTVKENDAIIYPEDTIEIVQREFRPLIMKTNAPVHYVSSSNDYWNIHDVKVGKMEELSVNNKNKLAELELQEELRRTKLEADRVELESKLGEFKKLEAELALKESSQTNKEDLERLKNEIKNRKKEVATLELGYKSYTRYLSQIKTEVKSAGFTKLTKQFRLKTDEYNEILENAVGEYYTLYNGMFNIADLHIHRHQDEDVTIDGVLFNMSYNRNFQMSESNQPVQTGIKRNVSRLKLRSLRKNNNPDVMLEAYNKGGFKAYVERKPKNEDDTYLVQLPPFWDEDGLERAKRKFIKTWHSKMLDYPFASGAVLYDRDDSGVTGFEYYSHKLLKKIAENTAKKPEKLLKIEIISDFHDGSPNYLNEGDLSNYEMLEAVMAYQKKAGLPNILIMAGDMMHGTHKEEIKTEHPGKTVFEYEKDLSSDSKEVRDKALRELKFSRLINNVGKQKDDFRLRYIDRYAIPVLENGGEVIIISGQHFDKSVDFSESEASEIARMIPSSYSNRVHVLDGGGNGAGIVTTNGLKIFGVHKPKQGSDELDGLEKHIWGMGTKVDLAVGGDRHRGGVAYAEEMSFVSAFGLQTKYTYVDGIGLSKAPRGVINVYLNPDCKGYAKYEFITDSALRKVWNGIKAEGRDVPTYV